MMANRATGRLVKAGWLVKLRCNAGEYAQAYGWEVAQKIHLHTLTGSVCKCSTLCHPDHAAHPAFEHRGLGRYAGRVFQALAELGEANARQVAERAGCAGRTVRKWLRIMLRWQLVGYDPSRRIWWACPDVLDGVAHVLQTNALEVGPALAPLRILPVAKTVAGWGGC